MWASYIFHFFEGIVTSKLMKNLILFCILYVAMSNIHFSGFDNVKNDLPNTYVSELKFPSKLLLGKDLFICKRVFKQKGVVSKLHICSNGLGKIWASYIFHFFEGILTSKHMKNLILFCILYVAMSNIHFSGFDNVKMTCQTHTCKY